jgi:hypothetical protein
MGVQVGIVERYGLPVAIPIHFRSKSFSLVIE